MQPIYEFGGTGTIIHLAVANGFPPQTYKPFIDPLTKQYRAVCLPPRALWPGETPPERWVNWKDGLGQDLITAIRDHDLRDIIGIGHSFGGVATLLAAIAEPERFKAVVLLDPTILPRRYMWMLKVVRFFGIQLSNRWSQGAERRRTDFESVEEGYQYFRGKRLFSDWSDEAVRHYAETLAPAQGGNGLTLAWPRAWEAYYFRTLYTETWGDLPKFRGKVPALLIRGETSNTLFPEVAARIQRILPEMTYAEIAGHGHLFPLSAPEEARQVIGEWLATLSL